MEMKLMQSEHRLCTCCMEEHDVKTVRMMEHVSYKRVSVDYEAVYFYCDVAEELYMDESQIKKNDAAMKNAYRKSQGLLTAQEIAEIREKYDISQSDLCMLLGWGGKTITRYESHQVQDKAHDSILRKLDQDPEWFIYLQETGKEHLKVESYGKYFDRAAAVYETYQDLYLRKAIEGKYIRFKNHPMLQGNTQLSLDKVVDMIRYFAASDKVTELYKVKLMKLLWYADALSYKKRGCAMTGLVYQAFPMGAVPIGHDLIIDLKNVPCEEIDMGETYAYHFFIGESIEYPFLTNDDKKILEIVIDKLGKMSKKEIVDFMHKERAYEETEPRDINQFKYAESLQI